MTPKVIMDLRDYQLMDEMIKHKDRLINEFHSCYQIEDFSDKQARIRVSKSAIQNLIIVMHELDIYEGKIEWIWEDE